MRCLGCGKRFATSEATPDAAKAARGERVAPPAQLVPGAACPSCGSRDVRTYSTRPPSADGKPRHRYVRCSSCGRRFCVDVVSPASVAENQVIAAGLTVRDLERLGAWWARKRFRLPEHMQEDAIAEYVAGALEAAARLDVTRDGHRKFMQEWGRGRMLQWLRREGLQVRAKSLDAAWGFDPDGDSLAGAVAPNTEVAGSARLEAHDLRTVVAEALASLKPRNATIVRLVMLEGRTAQEAGKRLGITRARVCQLGARAMARLRRWFRHHYPKLEQDLPALGGDPAPDVDYRAADRRTSLARPRRVYRDAWGNRDDDDGEDD